jgi:hypothetical protein
MAYLGLEPGELFALPDSTFEELERDDAGG